MRRVVLLGLAVALIVGAIAVTPRLLRHVSFFRVRRVELVGLHYLAPDRVLDALDLGAQRNLFDPLGGVQNRGLAIPGVIGLRIARRLPGTLRVTVEEQIPIAFAPGPNGLVSLDASARPLPYDAAVTGFDLPLVPRPDSVLTRALAAVQAVDSTLYEAIDGAHRAADGSIALDLDRRVILLPPAPTPDGVRAVAMVRWHLMQSGQPYAALDARYSGWVVVRRGNA